MNPEKDSCSQEEQPLLDHAEQLIWSLLDDQIEEKEVKHLEELMKVDEQVRLRYLQCAQIHAGLYAHYQTEPAEPQSPVLGALQNDFSTLQGGPASLLE